MAIKTYKPTTPGRRQMTNVDYSCLSKVAPEKSLLSKVKKNAGWETSRHNFLVYKS